jgi:hypothetical protein
MKILKENIKPIGLFFQKVYLVLTPKIFIDMKGNKIKIAIIHALLFAVLFSIIIFIMKMNTETMNEERETCPGTAVHNARGQGAGCIQCPSMDGKQLAPFPYTVKTDTATMTFDGYCGFANTYDNGRIATVSAPNPCPNKSDTPVFVPGIGGNDPNIRFCLANPTSYNMNGINNFNIVLNPSVFKGGKVPIYFQSV